jgi:hypothetical protein
MQIESHYKRHSILYFTLFPREQNYLCGQLCVSAVWDERFIRSLWTKTWQKCTAAVLCRAVWVDWGLYCCTVSSNVGGLGALLLCCVEQCGWTGGSTAVLCRAVWVDWGLYYCTSLVSLFPFFHSLQLCVSSTVGRATNTAHMDAYKCICTRTHKHSPDRMQ